MMSVNVPPRSIQKSHLPLISFSEFQMDRQSSTGFKLIETGRRGKEKTVRVAESARLRVDVRKVLLSVSDCGETNLLQAQTVKCR